MPLQESRQIVSLDDHLVEPAQVWRDRVPQRLLDGALRMYEAVGYSHSDSNWTNSVKRACEVLAPVPNDEVEKTVEISIRGPLRLPRVGSGADSAPPCAYLPAVEPQEQVW